MAAGDAQPRPHGNTYWLLPGRVLAGEHPGAAGAHALPLRLQGTVTGVVNAVNPQFMSVLWTDPAGIKLVIAALCLMALGTLWIWRIVDIRA